MRRRTKQLPDRSDPEFLSWLKEKKVSKRKLKNPEVMDQHFQEWVKTRSRSRGRGRSLLNLSSLNFDIGSIVNGVRIATEVMKTFQNFRMF